MARLKTALEIRGILTGLALVAIPVLVSISVDVGVPGQSLLHSLRFHIGLGCLVLALLLLLSGARWRAAALAAIVALSLAEGSWMLYQQFERRTPLAQRPVASSFELLSFNVLNSNPRGQELVEFMLLEAPDIIVTLESPSIAPYRDELAAVFPFRAGCDAESTCDTAIFSRLPLSETRVHRFGAFQRERLVVARAEAGGRLVTLVAVHLTKPYFDEMAEVELEQLTEELQRLEGPLVLVGDFNAAAWSDALVRLGQQLDLVPPPALPATWPVRAGDFGVPIDNMFTRGDVLIGAISAVRDSLGSNHRGLLARIDVLEPATAAATP